jgi:dihydrofolate reductase
MRKIVAFDKVSADGYFATAEGRLDWTVPEPELEKANAAAAAAGPGTMLFGRRTYDMFEMFWPHALDESGASPDPHAAGRRTPEMRAFAVSINEANKIVFSRTRKDVTWKNSRLLREIDARQVEALKQEPGADIMIFGSGSVVTQLTALGLVDEYHLVVSPVFLGGGRSLLSGVPKLTRLELLEAKPYPAGNVMLRYAPRRG